MAASLSGFCDRIFLLSPGRDVRHGEFVLFSSEGFGKNIEPILCPQVLEEGLCKSDFGQIVSRCTHPESPLSVKQPPATPVVYVTGVVVTKQLDGQCFGKHFSFV